jgi:hypothetical protein
VFKYSFQKTFVTGTQKYLAKRKLDSISFINKHSGITNAPERIKRMKCELQLFDSHARIPRASRDEQVHKKAAASATIEKCGPAAAVKPPKQRIYVSKLTMPEIRALSLFYFKTEIAQQRK